MPELLQRINAARSAAGNAPLKIDRGLALVAQQARARYQRLGRGRDIEHDREQRQRVADEAYRELAAFSLTFREVFAEVERVDNLDQAVGALQHALDPEMHWAGLDVARAPGSTTELLVVLTVGR